MEIGTRLRVHAIVDPYYTPDGYRHIGKRWLPVATWGWYVGYTFKQEGKYDPGDKVMPLAWDEPMDYEHPRLVPQKFLLVYRVRFHERGVEHYCFPEDVEVFAKKKFMILEVEFGDIMDVFVGTAENKDEAVQKYMRTAGKKRPPPDCNIYDLDKVPSGFVNP